jgi:hypothetical protein
MISQIRISVYGSITKKKNISWKMLAKKSVQKKRKLIIEMQQAMKLRITVGLSSLENHLSHSQALLLI